MKIKFWGVRGSIATPGRETIKYGGDTACIEVRVDGELIILDAGTGIRRLGLELVNEFGNRPIETHIIITHTHLDHIQGLLFFIPAFMPQNKITIYGCEDANKSMKRLLAVLMAKEYFPVSLDQMEAEIQFVELSQGKFSIGKVQAEAMFMNHPGLAFGYKILSSDGKVVVYTGDVEPYYQILSGNLKSADAALSDEAQRLIDKLELELVQFVASADLLIFDAQYTPEEYGSKIGWGHSPWDYAVKVGLKAQARKLALFHHAPIRFDDDIDKIIENCRNIINEKGASMECFGARVGQQIIL
jgi:phosphoribosyl 1,2-cyclic phosphodiesterase